MIHSDTHSSLRSCNVSIFKGLVCGFMPDLCMWGNFFFHLHLWIVTTWAFYFSEPQSGILFKAFVFIVTWKYAIGVIKCSILLPEIFIWFLFPGWGCFERFTVHKLKAGPFRPWKLIREQNWNSSCQFVLFCQIKCRVQNKRILTRYLRITVRSHHG